MPEISTEGIVFRCCQLVRAEAFQGFRCLIACQAGGTIAVAVELDAIALFLFRELSKATVAPKAWQARRAASALKSTLAAMMRLIKVALFIAERKRLGANCVAVRQTRDWPLWRDFVSVTSCYQRDVMLEAASKFDSRNI